MFANFLNSISFRNSKKIASLLANNIVRVDINFSTIKSNFNDLNHMTIGLIKLKAFDNKKKLLKFLMFQVIRRLWDDARINGFKMSHVLFLLYKFNFLLGRKQINSLVAYTLAKLKLYSPNF
jgi:hypothetical protein